MESEKKKKTSSSKLKYFVAFSIAMVTVYTVAELIITYRTGISNDTLTTCFFAMFGGEIFSCALIKVFKLRKDNGES